MLTLDGCVTHACVVLMLCRDFSNGYLVAEIFSRYYAKDIYMHAYENGTATAVKKANWAQLCKVR